MRGSPVVKNRCIHPGCGVELSNNHSLRCRKHYIANPPRDCNEREVAKEMGEDDVVYTLIEGAKCPQCGRTLRYHEGFHHKLRDVSRPTFIDCGGGECFWSFFAPRREVEHDN